MQPNDTQQSLTRRAALIGAALLLAGTAACTTLEASLDHGSDSSASTATHASSGDILDQMARDSQGG